MKNLLSLFLLPLLLVTFHVVAQQTNDAKSLDSALLVSSDEIFLFVDSVAMPVGGYESFYHYIGINLQYPQEARASNITGKVIVEFVIEKDGSISSDNIKVLKSPHKSLSKEAIRIMKNAPDWTPGRIKGIRVRSKKVLPITFNLG